VSRTSEILAQTKATLQIAWQGWQDLASGPPERRRAGLQNAIVWGRAVTNHLQNLRGVEPGFDAWYETYKVEMAGDPLMRFFYELRSKLLKEAAPPPLLGTAYLPDTNSGQLLKSLGPRPVGAISAFFGDLSGGSGWIVVSPGGEREKVYVNVSESVVKVGSIFANLPTDHLGKPVTDSSPSGSVRLYLDYLQRMVDDAHNTFLSGKAP
jgi:hypothetical protein